MSSTVEGEFDPGTLHRLIELKGRQRGKKLSLRSGQYDVETTLVELGVTHRCERCFKHFVEGIDSELSSLCEWCTKRS